VVSPIPTRATAPARAGDQVVGNTAPMRPTVTLLTAQAVAVAPVHPRASLIAIRRMVLAEAAPIVTPPMVLTVAGVEMKMS